MFGIDDIALGVGPQIISGLLQWQNSEDAAKASREERARISQLINNLKDPNFDTSMIQPQDYKIVGKYVPEVAPYVAEANPTLMKGDSADASLAKNAQRDVLSNYLSQAKSGNDPLLEIQQRRAAREAASSAASNRASLDGLFARRGMSPGGAMQYGAALSGVSDAQDREAQLGEQAAQSAYGNRQNALANASGLAGNIYNREASQEQQNAGIMNDFNRRMASGLQSYGQNAANTRNQGQQYNLGVAQNLSNANNDRGYAAQTGNQSLRNSVAQQTYGNQVGKVGMQQGVANQAVNDINTRTAGQNAAIQGIGEAGSAVGKQLSKNNRQYGSYF